MVHLRSVYFNTVTKEKNILKKEPFTNLERKDKISDCRDEVGVRDK